MLKAILKFLMMLLLVLFILIALFIFFFYYKADEGNVHIVYKAAPDSIIQK